MKTAHSSRAEQIAVVGLDIDGDVLPMVLLMIIGTTRPGRWDDVSLARLMDKRPSQIRAALIDLDDWGFIQACGSSQHPHISTGQNAHRMRTP